MLVIGLMSGTSLDGIDAAIVRFEGTPPSPEWSLVSYRNTTYTHEQREEIHNAILHGNAAAFCRLNARLGEWLARAVLEVCDEASVPLKDIALIGSHGQTVWHEPPGNGRRGSTFQLGCAATIAERTGVPVVSDFRSRDVAAGGHGAPLVPWADRFLFASPEHARVLVNIGGMANLTRVPMRGADERMLAFDTGPGNAPIDAVVSAATDGKESFDDNGDRAAAGNIDPSLLDEMLRHPFFDLEPPRSTGREQFGEPWVHQFIDRARPTTLPQWNDLIATTSTLVVRSIVDALQRWVLPLGVGEILVTGGGASNQFIMRHLAEAVAPVPLRSGSEAGIDADAKEAIAFAGLAWAHVMNMPGNVPEATGAGGPRLLGSLTPA